MACRLDPWGFCYFATWLCSAIMRHTSSPAPYRSSPFMTRFLLSFWPFDCVRKNHPRDKQVWNLSFWRNHHTTCINMHSSIEMRKPQAFFSAYTILPESRNYLRCTGKLLWLLPAASIWGLSASVFSHFSRSQVWRIYAFHTLYLNHPKQLEPFAITADTAELVSRSWWQCEQTSI